MAPPRADRAAFPAPRRILCPLARRAVGDGRSHRGARPGSLHGRRRGADPGPRQRATETVMKARLDHVGIAVADLAQALAFYRDALGLEVDPAEDVPSQQVRAHFIPAGGPTLELLEATSATSPIATSIAKRGPGLHHVAL